MTFQGWSKNTPGTTKRISMAIDFRDRVNKVLNHAKNNFGEDAILYPKKGGSYNIRGIFDNDYEAINADTQQVITANQPVFGVNLFDFNFEIKEGDQLKIRNLMYKIYDKRSDGQGGASLLLHRCDHGQKVFKKKDSTSS